MIHARPNALSLAVALAISTSFIGTDAHGVRVRSDAYEVGVGEEVKTTSMTVDMVKKAEVVDSDVVVVSKSQGSSYEGKSFLGSTLSLPETTFEIVPLRTDGDGQIIGATITLVRDDATFFRASFKADEDKLFLEVSVSDQFKNNPAITSALSSQENVQRRAVVVHATSSEQQHQLMQAIDNYRDAFRNDKLPEPIVMEIMDIDAKSPIKSLGLGTKDFAEPLLAAQNPTSIEDKLLVNLEALSAMFHRLAREKSLGGNTGSLEKICRETVNALGVVEEVVTQEDIKDGNAKSVSMSKVVLVETEDDTVTFRLKGYQADTEARMGLRKTPLPVPYDDSNSEGGLLLSSSPDDLQAILKTYELEQTDFILLLYHQLNTGQQLSDEVMRDLTNSLLSSRVVEVFQNNPKMANAGTFQLLPVDLTEARSGFFTTLAYRFQKQADAYPWMTTVIENQGFLEKLPKAVIVDDALMETDLALKRGLLENQFERFEGLVKEQAEKQKKIKELRHQLKIAKQAHEAELDRQQEDSKKLTDSLQKDLSSKITQLEKQIELLSEELHTNSIQTEKTEKEYESTRQSLAKRIEQLELEKEDLEEKHIEREKSLKDKFELDTANLQEKIEKLEENHSLEKESLKKDLTNQIDDLNNKRRQLEDELRNKNFKTEADNQKLQTIDKDFNEKVRQLESEIEKLHKENTEKEKQLQEKLDDEVSKLKSEKERLKTEYTEKERELQEKLQAQTDIFEERTNELQKRVGELELEVEKENTEKDEFRRKALEITVELLQTSRLFKDEKNHLTEQNEKLIKQLENEQAIKTRSNEELAQSSKKVQELTTENDALKKLKKLKKLQKQFTEAASDKEEQLHLLEKKLKEVFQEKLETKAEQQELRAQAQQQKPKNQAEKDQKDSDSDSDSPQKKNATKKISEKKKSSHLEEMQRLNEQVEQLDATAEGLKTEITQAKNELAQAANQIAPHATVSKSSLAKTVHDIKTEIKEVEKQKQKVTETLPKDDEGNVESQDTLKEKMQRVSGSLEEKSAELQKSEQALHEFREKTDEKASLEEQKTKLQQQLKEAEDKLKQAEDENTQGDTTQVPTTVTHDQQSPADSAKQGEISHDLTTESVIPKSSELKEGGTLSQEVAETQTKLDKVTQALESKGEKLKELRGKTRDLLPKSDEPESSDGAEHSEDNNRALSTQLQDEVITQQLESKIQLLQQDNEALEQRLKELQQRSDALSEQQELQAQLNLLENRLAEAEKDYKALPGGQQLSDEQDQLLKRIREFDQSENTRRAWESLLALEDFNAAELDISDMDFKDSLVTTAELKAQLKLDGIQNAVVDKLLLTFVEYTGAQQGDDRVDPVQLVQTLQRAHNARGYLPVYDEMLDMRKNQHPTEVLVKKIDTQTQVMQTHSDTIDLLSLVRSGVISQQRLFSYVDGELNGIEEDSLLKVIRSYGYRTDQLVANVEEMQTRDRLGQEDETTAIRDHFKRLVSEYEIAPAHSLAGAKAALRQFLAARIMSLNSWIADDLAYHNGRWTLQLLASGQETLRYIVTEVFGLEASETVRFYSIAYRQAIARLLDTHGDEVALAAGLAQVPLDYGETLLLATFAGIPDETKHIFLFRMIQGIVNFDGLPLYRLISTLEKLASRLWDHSQARELAYQLNRYVDQITPWVKPAAPLLMIPGVTLALKFISGPFSGIYDNHKDAYSTLPGALWHSSTTSFSSPYNMAASLTSGFGLLTWVFGQVHHYSLRQGPTMGMSKTTMMSITASLIATDYVLNGLGNTANFLASNVGSPLDYFYRDTPSGETTVNYIKRTAVAEPQRFNESRADYYNNKVGSEMQPGWMQGEEYRTFKIRRDHSTGKGPWEQYIDSSVRKMGDYDVSGKLMTQAAYAKDYAEEKFTPWMSMLKNWLFAESATSTSEQSSLADNHTRQAQNIEPEKSQPATSPTVLQSSFEPVTPSSTLATATLSASTQSDTSVAPRPSSTLSDTTAPTATSQVQQTESQTSRSAGDDQATPERKKEEL